VSQQMHDDQIPSDVDVLRVLLQEQHPEWAELPIEPVASTGTDNALFRIGDDKVARLPLRPSSARPIDTEHRWLPVLGPLLPVDIPVPLLIGTPTDAFPSRWSVHSWVDGVDATRAPVDLALMADDLVAFLRALQAIDPTGGPPAREAYCWRGVPLRDRDSYTRGGIAACDGLVDDVHALLACWEDALAAPEWDRPPTWVHGDIAAGNLLVRDGRLHAVIDWGLLAVGDPACDLIVAWELLDGPARARFRDHLEVDDSTWERGRGWALSTAAVALPYYATTNPFMADQARRKLAAILLG
jgi:aminoglycoside phosphotransferase (APT) family kinase protein